VSGGRVAMRYFARRELGQLMLALLCAGCPRQREDPALERVEFGVLFGGDIQDRAVIPLELDPARQELSLRVTFRAPLTRERVVSWELERPSSQRGADGGTLFAAELGEIKAGPGERRAEAKIAFRRGDLPGTWRLHVRLDGRAVLERAFTVGEP
jgi:hypothetical protein